MKKEYRNLKSRNKNFNKAILLIGREKVGGAEKRFGRAFVHLAKSDENIFLIINQVLYASLIKHGIPLDKTNNVILIKGTGYSRTSFPALFLSALSLSPKILKIVRDNDIKLLHSMGFLFLINFLLSISPKKIYQGISICDSRFEQTVDRPLLKFLFKTIIKRADFIDFLSEDIKEKFSKGYGPYFKGRYLVSPCSFIDYSLFNPEAKTKENNVVFLARLIEDKNPFLFMDAIPAVLNGVLDKYKDIKFYIVGDGPLEKALKEHACHLGIEDHMLFTYSHEPSEILCSSKIFLSLQRVNNYPSQSLIEAMACENAVIATDVGETWKLVDESTGVRVAANSEAIADSIITLFNEPDKLKRLGEEARKRVMKEHTIERFASYLTDEVYHLSPL